MYCNNCGTKNPDTSQYCSNCGKQLAPAAPPPPPVYQAAPPPYAAPQRKTNGMAIAALVTGIASYVVGITSIPAIILGIVALNQIKKDPTQDGKGMAIAGIVLGSVFIVLTILAFLLFFGLIIADSSWGSGSGISVAALSMMR